MRNIYKVFYKHNTRIKHLTPGCNVISFKLSDKTCIPSFVFEELTVKHISETIIMDSMGNMYDRYTGVHQDYFGDGIHRVLCETIVAMLMLCDKYRNSKDE